MSRGRPTVVLLTTPDKPVHEDATKILGEVAEVKCVMQEGRTAPIGEALEQMKGTNAILLRGKRITRDTINAVEGLKIIARHGAGVDTVDMAAATEKGIVVTNTPVSNSTAVAEHAFSLMMSCSRKIPMILSSMRNDGWRGVRLREELITGSELFGKTLGVIGLGNVGKRVARRANAFGMKVLAFDPYVPKEEAEELRIELVNLEELLGASDMVTVHVPLTSETKHLIGEKELRIMKKAAYLINTSRGGAVDEQALCQALRERWIAGAALDVMEKEPPDPNSPLLSLENVIITPHIAAETEEALHRMATTAAGEIVRFFKGQRPRFAVNLEVLHVSGKNLG